MIRLALFAGLAITVLATGACAPGPDPASRAADHNLVIISVEALRADRVGAYGYERPTTPFLDALAGESVVFERAYAPSSLVWQSISALLTGRLPTSGGSVSVEAQPHKDAETLARLFHAKGVHTGLFSNRGGLNESGFTRGFEGLYISEYAAGDSPLPARSVARNALQFIDDYAPERFMVHAHFAEPAPPYAASADAAAELDVGASGASYGALIEAIDAGERISLDDPRLAELAASYDAEIAAVDRAIQTLAEGLDERGLSDNTVIVVTASQGQEFADHGYLGDGWTVYEEQLRVPLILRAPGLIAPERIRSPVSTIDIYPTLVALFGLDLDAEAWRPDGTSLLSDTLALRVLEQPKFAELVIREACITRAVVLNEWKYIADYIPCPAEDRKRLKDDYEDTVNAIAGGEIEAPSLWGEIRAEYLFNLVDDPGEKRNLLNEHPEQLDYLRERLGEYQRYSEVYAMRPVVPSSDRNRARGVCNSYLGC